MADQQSKIQAADQDEVIAALQTWGAATEVPSDPVSDSAIRAILEMEALVYRAAIDAAASLPDDEIQEEIAWAVLLGYDLGRHLMRRRGEFRDLRLEDTEEENEALAGLLMRQYGELPPPMFLGSGEEVFRGFLSIA